MLILFLTDPARDYGADFLYDGFRCLGATVVDWPLKASLHRAAEPEVDCDLNWSTHEWTDEEIHSALAAKSFDLIVVPSLRDGVQRTCSRFRETLQSNAGCTVFVDGEDYSECMVEQCAAILGAAPAAHFKRELPIGARWAIHLPFGYPHHRRNPIGNRDPRTIYSAFVWDWAKYKVRGKLYRRFKESSSVDVPDRRLSMAENHAANRRYRAALVPAGAGYYTNRLWEVVADGCIPIIESPHKYGIEPSLPSGVPTFRTTRQAAREVHRVLRMDAAAARDLAEDCQRQWLEGHTSAARAQTVWSAVHGETPFPDRHAWFEPSQLPMRDQYTAGLPKDGALCLQNSPLPSESPRSPSATPRGPHGSDVTILSRLIGLRQSTARRAPDWIVRPLYALTLPQRASLFRRRCEKAKNIDELVKVAFSMRAFSPFQIPSELASLLEIVRALRPELVCEIGTALGGTLHLVARMSAGNARILSVDIHYHPGRQSALRRLLGSGQRLDFFHANSGDEATVERTRRWLNGKQLDLLFIDGDHSYKGVSADFKLYSPLVRPGGIVALHDIVPDLEMQQGARVGGGAGEVPYFWEELKREHPDTVELVESWEQNGAGIGILRIGGPNRVAMT